MTRSELELIRAFNVMGHESMSFRVVDQFHKEKMNKLNGLRMYDFFSFSPLLQQPSSDLPSFSVRPPKKSDIRTLHLRKHSKHYVNSFSMNALSLTLLEALRSSNQIVGPVCRM